MKTLLIINPYSCNKKSGKLAERIMTYMHQNNYPCEFKIIEKFSDAYTFAAEANHSGFDKIVAVGGDGTINKVINSFFDDNGKKVSNSCCGVIHTGTSPDFCKSYRIPTDIYKAADVIMNNKVADIPVGMIKLNDEFVQSGSNRYSNTKYFVCCANIGLGASLARSAGSGIRAYLGNFLGTFVSFIKILASYKGANYEVVIDDANAEFKNVYNISVGITPYIASGLKVYKDKNISDDQFYILKVAEINPLNILPMIRKVYLGRKFANTNYIAISYARSVEIKNNRLHPEVEFDGDPAGFLPCKIAMAEDKLQILTS